MWRNKGTLYSQEILVIQSAVKSKIDQFLGKNQEVIQHYEKYVEPYYLKKRFYQKVICQKNAE